MNKRDTDNGFENGENRLAGIARGIVVGILMVGAVVIGSGMHRHSAVAADTDMAVQADDALASGYYPAQFPAPQGLPEPHIQAF